MPSFLTLAKSSHLEAPPIRGSRFIGHASPIESAEQALAHVQGLREQYGGANHHCYAWRLSGTDHAWRVFDDGEPSGTAGLPILARIDGAGLRGVIVVVTRFFGGTKLGRGGLVRAYGGTAGLLLDQAEFVTRQQCRPVRLHLEYGDHGIIRAVLASHGLQPESETFDQRIHLSVAVPIDDLEEFGTEIRDRTAGRVELVTEDD